MLKHILPDDIIDYINDFTLDKEEYRKTYERVLRELLWKNIHKQIRIKVQRKV
jgi:trehalose-6-phosphate synthase